MRNNLLLAFCGTLLGNLVNLGAVPPIKVWAIQEGVRISPTSGHAIEANRLIFPDALSGNYQDSNLVWDGKQRVVSLEAARNEIVAFQIIIERVGDTEIRDARVLLEDLVSDNGGRISTQYIDLYKQWYVRVRKRSGEDYSLGRGWYPDALLPCLRWTGNLFPHSYVLPFDIPDPLNNIGSEQKAQALWVDIYVPRDRKSAPPGVYESRIRIVSGQGEADLQLKLHIWDFMLPDESHLRGNIHTDTEINAFAEELELKYYQLMRRHRLVMGVLGYAPDISISGTDVLFDWTGYDARLGKYLDGTAFTSEFGYLGPGAGVPIEILVLPFDSAPMNVYKTSRLIQLAGKEFKFYRAWPVDVPPEGLTSDYEEIFKNAFSGFQDHFDGHPKWNRTDLIVFFLSLDEAYDEASYEKMLFYARLLEDSGADRLRFRIDGWYPMDVMERLSPQIDIVILGAGGFDPVRVKELRESGVEDWFYTSAVNIDADPLGQRALSWVCWKYGISSWTLWELDFNSLRAWIFPETYTTLEGQVFNGHGMLVYRGETMGLKEPVASIRLKLLRRGAQDYEYFWLLSQQQGGKERVDRILDSILYQPLGQPGPWGSPGMWNHNAERWEKARITIGELIHSGRSVR